jgi:hypothetical protein
MKRTGLPSLDGQAPEEQTVRGEKIRVIALFAERSSGQWVVRDAQGALWILPQVDNPWDHRQPFELTEGAELESVPGHYRYVLGLPT